MQTVQSSSYICNFVFDASDLLKSQIFADFIVPHKGLTLTTSGWGVKNFAGTLSEDVRTAQRERLADGLSEPTDYASYLASYVKHLGLGILQADSIEGVQVPLECGSIEAEVLLDPLFKGINQDHGVTIETPGADQSPNCDDVPRTIYGSSGVPFEPSVNTIYGLASSGLVEACQSFTCDEGILAHASAISTVVEDDAPGPIMDTGDVAYSVIISEGDDIASPVAPSLISPAPVSRQKWITTKLLQRLPKFLIPKKPVEAEEQPSRTFPASFSERLEARTLRRIGLSLFSESEETVEVVKPRKLWRKVFCMGAYS